MSRKPTLNNRAPIRIDTQVDTSNTSIEPITSHQAIPDESTAKLMIKIGRAHV